MPKEVIYSTVEQYNIEVGWNREASDVQVGIVTADGTPIANHLGPNGATEIAAFTSLWGNLDRAGINRLIKSLRTARDQAFGRDE